MDRRVTASRKILVTGADGFIGSHVTELLLARGFDVRAFVFYNSLSSWGWLDHLPRETRNGLDVFAGDVRDANGVREARADATPSCISRRSSASRSLIIRPQPTWTPTSPAR